MRIPSINPSDDDLIDFIAGKIRENYVIAFVGSPLRSDDRAGLVLYEILRGKGNDEKLMVLCEYGLETCVNDIIAKKPSGVIIIDAGYADNASPGSIIIAYIENIADASIMVTTHNIPLKMIIDLIRREAGIKDFYIIAIIAANIDIGIELSAPVKKAVNRLANIIEKALKTSSIS